MRLGIVAYVVPFAFVFQPALLGKAPAVDILLATLAAAAGVIVLAVGCVGYLARPLSWARRGALAVTGILALGCAGGPGRAVGIAALVAGVLLVLWDWAAARPSQHSSVQPGPERPATREIR
jgi:TRAP-type uncharacterized transport system fused permease subunit